MIGIAVVLGTITLCYANVDVENELMEIRTILTRQEKEIKALRNENRVLRADVKKMTVEIDNLKNAERISRAQVALKAEIERPRNKRLLPVPASAVAFYAYMSANEPNPSLHHSLIFNAVKTNVEGGYNQFSGMFSAPSPGLYVFTWTIYTGNHGQTGFHIYVNNDVVCATFGETDNNQNDYDSDSGSMVVSLNAHDNVYIRSSMACTTYVISDAMRRTTFAGWRLN
ncbi:complement C1q tumor necrosis factor-related protein 3-like [Crassostrea angulata]|uniref:complement C1q tumor necrosis factor-related protein 3-like n=1 Tax=Magallana angulata TaxID=2784310 RepID=UPI0022B0AE47|nr:complement C1q tumor necrosis factor-related protein 3-like [Crassostrea angulata]